MRPSDPDGPNAIRATGRRCSPAKSVRVIVHRMAVSDTPRHSDLQSRQVWPETGAPCAEVATGAAKRAATDMAAAGTKLERNAVPRRHTETRRLVIADQGRSADIQSPPAQCDAVAHAKLDRR